MKKTQLVSGADSSIRLAVAIIEAYTQTLKHLGDSVFFRLLTPNQTLLLRHVRQPDYIDADNHFFPDDDR